MLAFRRQVNPLDVLRTKTATRPRLRIDVDQNEKEELARIGLAALENMQAAAEEEEEIKEAMMGLRKQYVIPASAGNVLAGASFTINPSVPVDSTLVKYVVSSASGPYFSLVTVDTGRVDLISGGTGNSPADAFDPDSIPMPIDEPDVPGGTTIKIAGVNDDVNPRIFKSHFTAIDRRKQARRMGAVVY